MARPVHRALIGPVLGALLVVLSATDGRADRPRFAVYGDMPYAPADQAFLAGPAADRIRDDTGIGFVISVGDLGRPEAACDDVWQEAQRTLWRDLFRKPVFLTPGDNDWTDCDRATVPSRTSELERLDAIRRIHFAKPPALDAAWAHRILPAQPENQMWRHDGVQFVTVHVVGTANGRNQILLDDQAHALSLADARDDANEDWLAEAFRAARTDGSRAVVVAMQADPFIPAVRGGVVPATAMERCLANPAYAGFCRNLGTLAREFGDPVLLVHGDTNQVCLEPIGFGRDRPLFWRLNTWGDGTVPNMAVVSVEPGDADRPFRAVGMQDAAVLADRCEY